MKSLKNGFVSSNLITMRDKLSVPNAMHSEVQQADQDGISKMQEARQENSQTAYFQKEHRKALLKRLDEFRMLKREISGKITEKLASIPEDIKLSEKRVEELRNSVEKFADVLESLNSVEESLWDDANFSSELASAIKKAENARLEFIRVSSKISTLQRESQAADNSSASSMLPEICSLSFMQLIKIGSIVFLPLILTIIIMSIIIGIFIFATFRM